MEPEEASFSSDNFDSLSLCNVAAIKKQQEDTQPWTEKYRPQTLDGVIGQQGSVETLRGLMLCEEATFPHLILCGRQGTGKTTSILAVARELYGRHSVTVTGNQQPLSDMVLEINASDSKGIEVVRKHISVFVSTKGSISDSMGVTVVKADQEAQSTTHGKDVEEEGKRRRFVPKLIILDEADHLTRNAQNALRSLMEKHAEEVRFCFIVNYENKMHDAICSRCLRLRFTPLNQDEMMVLLRKICLGEQVAANDDALRAIVQVTAGDMRQAINTLQSCAMHARASSSPLVAESVYKITGKPPPEATKDLIVQCFAEHNNMLVNATRITNYLEKFGVSLKSTIDAMCQLIVDEPQNFRELGFEHEEIGRAHV